MEPDRLTQERVARNDARFRDANEQIEASAQSHGLEDATIPFLCECADMSCTTIIRLSIEEYEEVRANARTFAYAPGHEERSKGVAEVLEERGGYSIIRKQGYAGELAEELDQRQPEPGGAS